MSPAAIALRVILMYFPAPILIGLFLNIYPIEGLHRGSSAVLEQMLQLDPKLFTPAALLALAAFTVGPVMVVMQNYRVNWIQALCAIAPALMFFEVTSTDFIESVDDWASFAFRFGLALFLLTQAFSMLTAIDEEEWDDEDDDDGDEPAGAPTPMVTSPMAAARAEAAVARPAGGAVSAEEAVRSVSSPPRAGAAAGKWKMHVFAADKRHLAAVTLPVDFAPASWGLKASAVPVDQEMVSVPADVARQIVGADKLPDEDGQRVYVQFTAAKS